MNEILKSRITDDIRKFSVYLRNEEKCRIETDGAASWDTVLHNVGITKARYGEILAGKDITLQEFLAFCDYINVAPSAAVQWY